MIHDLLEALYNKLLQTLLIGLFALLQLQVHANNELEICEATTLVLIELENNHYSPPAFNSATRRDIIRIVLEDVDPTGMYFLSSDEKTLDSLVSLKNDTVTNRVIGNLFCNAIEKCCSIYQRRNMYTDSLVSSLLNAPLNFSSYDTLTFLPHGPVVYRDDSASLNNYITKNVKFLVLLAMHELKKDSVLKLTDPQLEEKARTKIIKRIHKAESHMHMDLPAAKKYIAEKFWNAMAQRCDPHSNYFNINDKNDFEKALSSKEYSYGLIVKENDNGEIEIVRLLPGSAAWKANELNVGDIITGVTTTDGKKVDFDMLSNEEIRELMESSANLELDFDIRKKSNIEKRIRLTKSKVESEINVINSYILKDSSTAVGFIPLPAFYVDNEGDNAPGCSNDVSKEIIKLKKENIKGLIIDLRNNAGGSLKEAMSLAGIFIDKGPLGIIRYRDKKPILLPDLSQGTVFDGPLIILTNGLSASASEFLSEVLQDYKRAVIVGGTTYGKGTGQNIMPVDFTSDKNGFLHITNFKFYRVTDSTNQEKGVSPDIALPDIYMKLDFLRESSRPYHLAADTFPKKVSYKPYPDLPVKFLTEESDKRIRQNKQFNKIKIMADSISYFGTRTFKLSLDKKSVNRYLQKNDRFDREVQKLSDYESHSYHVLNNQYLDKILTLDSSKKDQNDTEIKTIKSDAELEEAFLILKDLINYSTTHSK